MRTTFQVTDNHGECKVQVFSPDIPVVSFLCKHEQAANRIDAMIESNNYGCWEVNDLRTERNLG